MKKAVAKSCSIERIADTYLAELAKDAIQNKSYLLPDILREQRIYFDEGIITGALELLEGRKYIKEAGSPHTYTVLISPSDLKEIIIQSSLRYSDGNSKPKNVDFTLVLKDYIITAAGARFVRQGQILDIQGKSERETERKKRMERLINAAITIATTLLTMAIKWKLFDK